MLSIKAKTFDKNAYNQRGKKFCWGFASDPATDIVVNSSLGLCYLNLNVYLLKRLMKKYLKMLNQILEPAPNIVVHIPSIKNKIEQEVPFNVQSA